MTLHDISNGPSWVIWIVFALLVLMTITFFSGKGSALIAGFNTMSEEEKSKYDVKKLCRGMGWGFSVIDIMILIMLLGENVLPAWYVYVFVTVVIVDIIFMIFYGNVRCKK